jgi:hypothetical protein
MEARELCPSLVQCIRGLVATAHAERWSRWRWRHRLEVNGYDEHAWGAFYAGFLRTL